MKKIILVSGDPNSINSEIIFKSFKRIRKDLRNKIILISNFNLIKEQFKKLKYNLKLNIIKNFDENVEANKLNIIDIKLNFKDPFNVSKKERSKFIIKSLNLAHNLALEKNIIGLINCPIDKNLLNKKKIGVTEFLAGKCKIKENSEAMLLLNNKLSVSPITTHVDIKDVDRQLTKIKIIKKIETINFWFKKKYRRLPKILVLGLNPHNAEFRKESKEIRTIIPAIKSLKKKKIIISGPYPADTAFIHNYKNFNVIIGMYHDQVISPFKTIFKFNAVNVTLGLKYLRVSPDHGTAVDLIGQNKANYKSLIECIKIVKKFGK